MGLKYYLRGLGVGIVVTALILGLAAGIDSGELSDNEIRERARELGMVEESSVLSDTFAEGSFNAATGEIPGEEEPGSLPASDKEGQETEEQKEDMEEREASPSPAEEEKVSGTPEPSAATAAASAPTAEPTQAPAPTQTPAPEPTSTPEPELQQGESVTIQIVSGDSSLEVCRKLAQAGLVESASAYDAYLCQNGYDKRIRAGAFEIPVGATGEEIAGIILKIN